MNLNKVNFVCEDPNRKTLWLYDSTTEYLYRILLRERYGDQFCFESATVSEEGDYVTLLLSEDPEMICCPCCGGKEREIYRYRILHAYDIYQFEVSGTSPETDSDFLFHAPFIADVKYEHHLYHCLNRSCGKFYTLPQNFTYQPKSHYTKNFVKFIRLATLSAREPGGKYYIASNIEKINRMKPDGSPIVGRSTYFNLCHETGQITSRKRNDILRKKYKPPYMLRHWVNRTTSGNQIVVPDIEFKEDL